MANVISGGYEPIVQARIEEQRARSALGITRSVCWIAGGVIAMTVFIWLRYYQHWQLLLLMGLFAVMFGLALLYPWLHRRGQSALGIRLFLFSGLLVISFFPALLPPLLLAVMGDYIILAAMGYQLMGNWDGHIFAVVCVLGLIFNFVLINLWKPQWLVQLEHPIDWLIGGAFGVSTLVVAVVIIYMIVKGQERSFRQAQQSTLEVEARAATEVSQRRLIEQANAEIEKRMSTEKEQREQLQRILAQVQEAVSHLTTSSSEILATTAQQASGANEQSAAVAQASRTIEEVRSIAEQTAQRASGIADLAQHAFQVSQIGLASAADLTQGMDTIRQRVGAIAQQILALSEQAQTIGQIIVTVNEIATQSNMLALNAAVEAARAGETGRGFTVVAGEMRSLAEQSRAATVQVRELLGEIQVGVNTAVMTTEAGMKGAEVGIRLVGEAGRSIQRLTDSVTESVQASEQISAASNQQLAGMEQIAQAMQSIYEVTRQTATGAHQVEQAAVELKVLSDRLHQVVTDRAS